MIAVLRTLQQTFDRKPLNRPTRELSKSLVGAIDLTDEEMARVTGAWGNHGGPHHHHHQHHHHHHH